MTHKLSSLTTAEFHALVKGAYRQQIINETVDVNLGLFGDDTDLDETFHELDNFDREMLDEEANAIRQLETYQDMSEHIEANLNYEGYAQVLEFACDALKNLAIAKGWVTIRD